MPNEERGGRGKKRICLMGAACVLLPEGVLPEKAMMPISQDKQVMELLALLVLGREFLPPDGVRENGEVRRDWLAEQMYPAKFQQKETRQEAREKVRYHRDKLQQALDIRSAQDANTRERAVVSVGWSGVQVDVLALRDAAKQRHSPQRQEEIIALGERPLLEGMSFSWLQTLSFQRIRVQLDAYFLEALLRQSDSLIVQMEKANDTGRLVDADTYRSKTLPLLDKAAERLSSYAELLQQPEYAALLPLETQSLELRRRAAYLPPKRMPARGQQPVRIPRPLNSFVGRIAERERIQQRESAFSSFFPQSVWSR